MAYPPQATAPPQLPNSQFSFDHRVPYLWEGSKPILRIPHHEAFAYYHRIIEAPSIKPSEDHTIAYVLKRRELYIERLVSAMWNVTETQEHPDSSARQMFQLNGPRCVSGYDVEAVCRVLFDHVIERCQYGFRGPAFGRQAFIAQAARWADDLASTCEERMENVIRCLAQSKMACLNVLLIKECAVRLADHPLSYADRWNKPMEHSAQRVKAATADPAQQELQQQALSNGSESQNSSYAHHDQSPSLSIDSTYDFSEAGGSIVGSQYGQSDLGVMPSAGMNSYRNAWSPQPTGYPIHTSFQGHGARSNALNTHATNPQQRNMTGFQSPNMSGIQPTNMPPMSTPFASHAAIPFYSLYNPYNPYRMHRYQAPAQPFTSMPYMPQAPQFPVTQANAGYQMAPMPPNYSQPAPISTNCSTSALPNVKQANPAASTPPPTAPDRDQGAPQATAAASTTNSAGPTTNAAASTSNAAGSTSDAAAPTPNPAAPISNAAANNDAKPAVSPHAPKVADKEPTPQTAQAPQDQRRRSSRINASVASAANVAKRELYAQERDAKRKRKS